MNGSEGESASGRLSGWVGRKVGGWVGGWDGRKVSGWVSAQRQDAGARRAAEMLPRQRPLHLVRRCGPVSEVQGA